MIRRAFRYGILLIGILSKESGSRLNLLLLYIAWCLLITEEFIGEISGTAGYGAKVLAVAEELRGRYLGTDCRLSALSCIHSKNSRAALVEIAHHVSGVFIGTYDR